jgi:hypothetical protein
MLLCFIRDGRVIPFVCLAAVVHFAARWARPELRGDGAGGAGEQ